MEILFAIFFALMMAGLLSVLMIYVGRFKEYILERRKQENGLLIRSIDIIWRILLPIVFGIIAFILPLSIFCWMTESIQLIKSTKNLFSAYLYSFIPFFILSMFIVIRFGKI